MKSFKVSTTAQRKAALAHVIKKVTRGQSVGDTSVLQKFGVSGMITRLKNHGFLVPAEKKGYFTPDASLTSWEPLEILDLLYKNKNAKERKVMERLEVSQVPQPQVVTLFNQVQTPPDPSGMMSYPVQPPATEPGVNIGNTQEGDETAEHIAAALRLADRYQVKNVAQFVADYLKDTR